jgi:hypothetical protein
MKIVSALSKPAIRALIGDNREQLIRLAVRSPIRRVSAAARPDLDDLDPTSCHQGHLESNVEKEEEIYAK